MNFTLADSFVAKERPYDRGTFRHNAPRSFSTKHSWFARLLSLMFGG